MTADVEVTLFARARDLAGTDRVTLSLPDSAKVSDLRSALAEKHPELRPYIANLLIALENDYADDDTPIKGHQKAACFPPVSGG